ncbi:ATP-binding cassette domain-containing protein [Roseitranquillus sediminis]|uniref:ATP-binding cassette domain-containing protein n=1 Tax=Roseitranquillus sediminis TaxID=2809051 RepID=UPI001D0C12C2|nr:ATP-binding cassette domain-containing protein [Roseitranquillus sediminis]
MPVAARAPALMPLEVRGLAYEAGGAALVDGIDLTLTAGEITIVLGANGAGKSLLLRLLHGLIPASRGEMLWNGSPLDRMVRARQAMVFQKPVLLRRSVAANIDFVLAARGGRDAARRDALLHEVGLSDHAGQPARLLSGGEQQRLALARALATRPEVLFLDEPTASLDPASIVKIEQMVAAAHGVGTKIVFVTQDLGQARRLAGDVVFLSRGRVAEHSPAEEFFAEPASEAARDYISGRIVI